MSDGAGEVGVVKVFGGAESSLAAESRVEGPGRSKCEVLRMVHRPVGDSFAILRARDLHSGEQFTAVGHFANISEGENYELVGRWVKHAKYGFQLRVEKALPLRPQGSRAIERYLGSGLIKGIGEKTAARIVEVFGDLTLDILDHAPERLEEVPKINKRKAEEIAAAWAAQKDAVDSMVFLSEHNIPLALAARIYRHYLSDTISVVSQDPYALINIHGVGFATADRVALSFGVALDSPARLKAATLYLLSEAESEGHCYLTREQLEARLASCLSLSPETVDYLLPDLVDELCARGTVTVFHVDGHEAKSGTGSGPESGRQVEAVARSLIWQAEEGVASSIRRLLDVPVHVDERLVNEFLRDFSAKSGQSLSAEQVTAVRLAAEHRVFILTGGPGVGKTTTANAIIGLFKYLGMSVALAAPTGRAAQRLGEVSRDQARTIHRLLEWKPGESGFNRGSGNPVTESVILVDEFSMVDIRLAASLVSAIGSSSRLVIIGDVDQLPPVGPGNVLCDLLNSGVVPSVRLAKIFRQSDLSRIVTSAHAINAGRMPVFGEVGDGGDCHFIETSGPEQTREVVRELAARLIPESFGLDPVRDVQILTPMKKGDLGTLSLNEMMQEALNKTLSDEQSLRRGDNLFRQGDKVIQTSNNYDLGVFNGEQGLVTFVDQERGSLSVSFSDERRVEYQGDSLSDLLLAYAITVHKSQGSEFKAVIIICSKAHHVMLQRNLMYTALTRAREHAFFVGDKAALMRAALNQDSKMRQTQLAAKMRAAPVAAPDEEEHVYVDDFDGIEEVDARVRSAEIGVDVGGEGGAEGDEKLAGNKPPV